tara:strand:+ start:266 stop:415 length:150 start_codon:yes stop_codon:yes gene_type:complete
MEVQKAKQELQKLEYSIEDMFNEGYLDLKDYNSISSKLESIGNKIFKIK